MGGASSTPVELSTLERLTGPAAISRDDPFWTTLLTAKVPLQRGGGGSVAELEATYHRFCAELLRNNGKTGNFQTLLLCTLDHLEAAQAERATQTQLEQAAAALMLVRLFLRHMVETLEAEELLPHLELPAAAGGGSAAQQPLGTQLVGTLLELLAGCRLDDHSYALHMEAMASLVVCCSTQMFCELTSAAPQPLAVAALGAAAPLARRVTVRMLEHYTQRPAPPKESYGLLRALSSAAGFVLYLPWQVFSYFFRASDAPPPALADRALHLLLVLTQHLPPALFPAAGGSGAAGSSGGGGGVLEPSNEFLRALRGFSDATQTADADADADADAEGGDAHAHKLPFRALHDALAASLPSEPSVLLLYLLLHGNSQFLDYCITRTDADALLLPLLRPLYEEHGQSGVLAGPRLATAGSSGCI